MADEPKSKSQERREATMAEAEAPVDTDTDQTTTTDNQEGDLYSFPEHGIAVRAGSREEAEELLEAQLKKEKHNG